MFQVSQITNNANQTQTLVLPDGTLIGLTMRYSDQQYGWFADVTFGGSQFVLNGLRITTSPNMLRQFKNQIPFGLCCTTVNNQEATQIQDFASGFAKLYILDPTDVQLYEDFLRS